MPFILEVRNILSVSITATLFPAPIQQWAVWAPYPVGMFGARKTFLPILGTKPKSVGFTISSVVTTLIVFRLLLLLALLWFIQWKRRCRELHAV